MWRTVNARKLRVTIVHLPERGWIWPWFNAKIAETEQSRRAILMHKVTPRNLPQVLQAWQIEQPGPELVIDCSQACSVWGWRRARKPCDPPPLLDPTREGAGWGGFRTPWNGTFCRFTPLDEGWRCCFLRTSAGRDKLPTK